MAYESVHNMGDCIRTQIYVWLFSFLENLGEKLTLYLGYIRLLLTSYSISGVGARYVAVNKMDNGPDLLESTF